MWVVGDVQDYFLWYFGARQSRALLEPFYSYNYIRRRFDGGGDLLLSYVEFVSSCVELSHSELEPKRLSDDCIERRRNSKKISSSSKIGLVAT